MAEITTYANDSEIVGNERLIGTNVDPNDGTQSTANFLITDLKDYVIGDIPAASSTAAGTLSAGDKTKLNHLINLDTDIDVPQLKTDFDGFESRADGFATAAQGVLADDALSSTSTASQTVVSPVTIQGAVSAQDGISGDLTGDVIGDVTGNVDGEVTGGLRSSNGTSILNNGTDGSDATFTGTASQATEAAASAKIFNNADTSGTELTFRRLSEGEYQQLVNDGTVEANTIYFRT